MTVTGLDVVFYTALEEKSKSVQTKNNRTLYTDIFTSVGEGEMKSFIIYSIYLLQ